MYPMNNKIKWLGALLAAVLLLTACGTSGNTAGNNAGNDGSAVVNDTAAGEDVSAEGQEVDLGPLLDESVPLAGAPAVSTVLTPVASGKSVKNNSSATVDYSNIADGYVMVKWTGGGDPKLKVQMKGPSGTTYTYNLRTDGDYDVFPLSDGSGSYSVTVYKNISGTKYSTVLGASFSAKLTDEFAPFLRPNQYVNYTEDSAAVAKGAELTAGLDDNLEKVGAVYNYVVKTLTYDRKKAQTVTSGYLPDIDKVLEEEKGICFDYAALMAAMLRSQGVPVKLVVGYTGTVYHAWLNVWSEESGWLDGVIYFDGADWKLMDPTFASSGKQSESIMKYINNPSNYKAKYLY